MSVGFLHDQPQHALPIVAQGVVRPPFAEAVEQASLIELLAVARDQALVPPDLISKPINQLAGMVADSQSNAQAGRIAKGMGSPSPGADLADGLHGSDINALPCIFLVRSPNTRQLLHGRD